MNCFLAILAISQSVTMFTTASGTTAASVSMAMATPMTTQEPAQPGQQPAKCRHHPVAAPGCLHPQVTPGYGWATRGKASNRCCAAARILNQANSRMSHLASLSKGKKKKALQQEQDTACRFLLDPALPVGLGAATQEVLGISKAVFERGMSLTGSNTDLDEQPIGEGWAKQRFDKYPLLIVYHWIHNKGGLALQDYCEDVELNKALTSQWGGRTFQLGSDTLDLTCKPHLRRATKTEIAEQYLDSETHRRIIESNPLLSIDVATITSYCFCPCIEEEKAKDCACPICTDFSMQLVAMRGVLSASRSANKCQDDACLRWHDAAASSRAFADAALCTEKPFAGCEYKDDQAFMLRRPGCVGAGGATPCGNCGVGKRLPLPSCKCFDDAAMAKHVTWLKRQGHVEGKDYDRVVERLMKHSGEWRALLNDATLAAPEALLHKFDARLLRRLFHVDCESFDPETEAVILADFASAMKLGSGFKGTCESDATCNLYVVLVLFFNKHTGERDCHWVRFWSPAAASAQFHHDALKATVNHLKSYVTDLKRVLLWTDGCKGQYKGRTCFGRSSYARMRSLPTKFHAARDVDDWIPHCYGVEVIHSFFASHHASGVQDSAGKDARLAMIREIGFVKESIYDYHQCYIWSTLNMGQPKKPKDKARDWSPSAYFWFAFSDGSDAHRLTYNYISPEYVDFKPVKGSDSCYEFSAAALGVGAAESLRAGDSEAVIWSRQYPCRCLPCRHKRRGSGDDKDDDCWNLHFFAPAKKHDTSHKKTWTVEETAQKKKDSKQKRKEKAAEKAAAILKGAGSAEWRVAAELQEAAAAEAEDAEDEEAAAEEAEADDMNDE